MLNESIEHEFDKFDFEKEHMLPFLIVSSNFIIRPLINQDKVLIIEALRESLKMLHMWLPWTDDIPSHNDAVALGEQFFKESCNFTAIHYVIYQNEKLMGMCSLSNYDKLSNSARLGYWCRSNSEQSDQIAEAINAIASYTFQNTPLQKLFIPCIVGNFVNESIAKALNFTLLTIELTHDQQIKIFKIDSHTALPKVDFHWIKDDKVDHINLG